LNYRSSRAFEQPEVRQQVVFARSGNDLGAVVVPRPIEQINRRSGTCSASRSAFRTNRLHRVTDAIDVRPVRGKRELNAFIKLPFRLYKDDPLWVAPLLMDLKKQLNPSKNPWFEHAEAEFFIAWRGGRAVGRISAHVDRNFNQFQDNEWGLFGWFEAEDDLEAAAGLFDAAAVWLRERGRDRMVGPFNYTTNDECGVVIEGFEVPPSILEPYTKRYYPSLFDGAEFDKAMDLLMYKIELEDKDKVHPAIWGAAKRIDESDFTFKRFSKRSINADVDRFLDIYNASWEKNWGFVPLQDEEVRHYAKTLKPILDPNWAFVLIGNDGDNAAAALTLPDYNQVLKHLNGRLLPLGWVKALWYQRKIDRVRVFALGVKPKYRTTGLGAKLYAEHFAAAERTGVSGGTMGWILEDNKPMNKAMLAMGATVIKRFRLYERPL
jgi:GNAT superfamily N-acetyltransferase